MIYKFICPKCSHEEEIVMSVNDYTAEGHMCPECGEEMKRNPKNFCQCYNTQAKDFFGKTNYYG